MSKLYRNPIEVHLSKTGFPLEFCWRKRWYHIITCTEQKDAATWPYWHRRAKLLYRCVTNEGVTCDIIKDKAGGWIIERIWD